MRDQEVPAKQPGAGERNCMKADRGPRVPDARLNTLAITV